MSKSDLGIIIAAAMAKIARLSRYGNDVIRVTVVHQGSPYQVEDKGESYEITPL